MPAMYESVEDPARLLAHLLPLAREPASQQAMSFEATSGLGAAAMARHRIDNLEGVRVFRQPGGWCADLVFGKTTAGISNVIGTPVESPLDTEAQAVDQAVTMLAMFVAAQGREPPPVTDPVFLYHGYELVLPQLLMDVLSVRQGQDGEYVRRRLREFDASLASFDEARMAGLEHQGRTRLMSVAALALLNGIVRWPERVPGMPCGEAAGVPGAEDGLARAAGGTHGDDARRMSVAGERGDPPAAG